MIESENLKHSKTKDHALLKIHANKDIIIHAKKERNGSKNLSQVDTKDEIKVPKAMEPAAFIDKNEKKSETLPVYTEMKKNWVPNEDGV